MSDFELDSRLATDSVLVAEGPLSQVRLMNDERFPWLVLVPRLAGITEWIELDGEQQDKLRTELNRACKALKGHDGVEKINIGALGNIVRQLHVHLVGRHSDGRFWVQQRAHDKPNDPGMWDTLMGGMVSAADSLPTAFTNALRNAGIPASAVSVVVQPLDLRLQALDPAPRLGVVVVQAVETLNERLNLGADG